MINVSVTTVHTVAGAGAAHRHGLHVHVDGARLFNAVAASDYRVSDFARQADTVSVCFSKGLGAPVGSALVGSRELITRARRFRKMFGGTMRQSGMLAAAALYALDHNLEGLGADHRNARTLAGILEGLDGVVLERPPAEVPSNMVFFGLAEGADAGVFCHHLEREGVLMLSMGPRRIRAVTHLDVDEAAIEAAGAACARTLETLHAARGG